MSESEHPGSLPPWEVHPALPRLVDWMDHLGALRCPRCGYERDTPNHELGCAAGRAEQPPGMNDWATFPIGSCGTCDGGGCPDCTDPVG